jgi:hypothetical protein
VVGHDHIVLLTMKISAGTLVVASAFLDCLSDDFGIIYALAPLAERRPFLAGRSPSHG